MSDQFDSASVESQNSDGGTLASARDVITDLVTGSSIPAPIKKNAFKAFSQLCTAVIDIPVAYLEGIATETRAITQARTKIITTEADQIVKQMDVDSEFSRVAVKKYGQKIVREQVNLDKVVEIAAHQIQKDAACSTSKLNETTEIPPINEDWLNHFEGRARQKSTEEMQILFGRILAGEIQRPSSFSRKTVTLVDELDTETAALFRRLCSLCVSLRARNIFIDARVISIGAGHDSLKSYGLSFDALNVLHEHGLIIPNYDSYADYRGCIADENNEVEIAFSYQGRQYGLLPMSKETTCNAVLLGVALSRAGRELLPIVDIQPSDEYTAALIQYFVQRNFEMTEIIEQ
jgi:hypothetical protein